MAGYKRKLVQADPRGLYLPRVISADQKEYAGLPGSSASAHFFKSISQSQLSRQLYERSNIVSHSFHTPFRVVQLSVPLTHQNYSISSVTSVLWPLSRSPTELPDRLFLGGPNSVRGWKVGGMGLHDAQDSLGGELSWGLGLSVFAPIWGKAHWPVRGHGFLNLGKVTGYDRGECAICSCCPFVLNGPRLSEGCSGVTSRRGAISS